MVALVVTWSRILYVGHPRGSSGFKTRARNISEFDSLHCRLDYLQRVLRHGICAFCEVDLVFEKLEATSITLALNCATDIRG
jgi:hypothetical protein